MKAGVDFPSYYWQLATGEPVSAPTDYEPGVATHRIGGEFVYLMSFLNGTDDTFVEPPPVTVAIHDDLESVYR